MRYPLVRIFLCQQFFLGSILTLLLIGFAGSAAIAGSVALDQATHSTPNIIYVFTDDQPWFTLCGLPDAPPDLCAGPIQNHPMPVVEQRLMAEGTVFTQAVLSDPLCCPSRASLLSGGFFSHHTNVTANQLPNGGFQRFIDTDTLATRLQHSGYKTAIIGKYLNSYNHKGTYIPPGWDNFVVSGWHPDFNSLYEFVIGSSTFDQSGTGSTTLINDGTYITDYAKDQALQFIDQTCPGSSCAAPFFLFFSTHLPHSPATPAPRHAELFPGYVYRGRGWGELPDGDLSDKPAYVRQLANGWNSPANDEFHRDQLRSLRAVDEAVGAIITRLEEKNLLNNTVIIFASDNGLMWAMHQLGGKDKPYEESIRAPLFIRLPGSDPQVIDKLVAVDLDVAPTILELAGLAPVENANGSSLLPLIEDPLIPWRDELLIQGGFQGDVPTWAGIRTEDSWKYVEYVTGEKELYHLAAGADPFELESKHADPAYADTLADLASRLDQLDRGLAIVTGTDLPIAAQGRPYSVQLTAWGGNGTYTWSTYTDFAVCAGPFPSWLTLSASGILAGTPPAVGTTGFCVKVQDTSQSPQPGNNRPQEHIKPFQLQVVQGIGRIDGLITDASTGAPIPNATVTIAGLTGGTNSQGYYRILDIPIGVYDVTASAPGYLPTAAPGVSITDNNTTTLNLALEPDTSCMTACLRSTSVRLRVGAQNVSGQVLVKDENGARIAGATVSVTWTLPDLSTLPQSAVTSAGGVAQFSVTGGTGLYTLTITNITQDGYAFDAANSVLSDSITK